VASPLPRPPFDRWPIQLHDPAFGFGWYTRPVAFVTQAIITTGTLEAVRVVQGWIDLLLRERAEEIRDAGGLFVFHDWNETTGYTSDARKHYLARMRARPRDYLRHSVTVVRPHPLFRMAVEAGNLVAALTARAKVELASDAATALAAHRIEPPALKSRFPGT